MSEKIQDYLPDPEKGVTRSEVFIEAERCEEYLDWSSALRFLINQRPRPLQLRSTARAPNLTVVVEASATPRILFGRSRPSGNNTGDLNEIKRVLKANGLETRGPEASDA